MSCCCPPKEDGDLQPDSPQKKLLHTRKCTDCCCCLLFLLSVGLAVLLALASFQVGNPGLLMHGKDYTGKMCGLDEGVLDLPKVAFPRLAKDLADYQQKRGEVEGTPTYEIPIYAICVAECPEAGDIISDYGCLGEDARCQWRRNPLDLHGKETFGKWHVGVGTKDVVNRCLPYVERTSEKLELCAEPDCHEAGKKCFTENFKEENYWVLETEEDTANCLRNVNLETTRSFTSPQAGLIETFIGESVGGIFGAVQDLTRAALEIVAFGVVAAVLLNFIVLVLLRYVIRVLFYLATVFIILLLCGITLVLFAKAGLIDMSELSGNTLSALSSASAATLNALAQTDNEQLGKLAETALQNTESALSKAESFADKYSSISVFDVAPEEQQPNYKVGAWVSVLVTLLTVMFVCMLLNRLNKALEICKKATIAVFTMPGLITLPLFSTAFSLVAMGFFVLVASYMATPDPALIIDKLNEYTSATVALATDVANKGLDMSVDLAQKGLSEASKHGIETGAVNLSGIPDELVLPELALDVASLNPELFQKLGIAYELFMSLWLLFFVDAIVYTSIAAAIGYWYFVHTQPDEDGDGDIDGDGLKDKSFAPMVGSLGRVLRYHLGSMAMGSFILAVIRLIRFMMVYLDEQMKTNPAFRDSFVVKLCMKCIHCVLWCFEQSIKFLTRYTYVFVALEGLPFCPSAVQTYRLVTHFPLQMLANEIARAVLGFLQTLIVPVACAWLGYLSVLKVWRASAHETITTLATTLGASDEFVMDELELWEKKPSAVAVAIAILVISYAITSSFKIVYSAAIDTLFVCMFRDAEQFGGKYAGKHVSEVSAYMGTDEQEGTEGLVKA